MTKHIFVYGYIGTATGEVSINAVKAQLDPAATDYILHIISGGGNVFEGYGIYNILKNTGKPITTHVEGLCASIATLVAAAGNKIIMNRTSEFMIHNPKVETNGDANQLRGVAEQLDKIKNVLIDVYARRTSLGKEKLWELYDNETWLTAQEAQQMGFVDDVQDAIKAVAKVDLKKQPMKKSLLKRVLDAFKNATEYALADGRMIICEGELAAGEQVSLSDGSPLEAGTHQLAPGGPVGSITTDESGTITQVDAAAPAEDKQNKEMEDKIKELEAQLAEARQQQLTEAAAKTDAQKELATAKADNEKFQNRLTEMEKNFLKLKEEVSKTIGDQTPPPPGPVNKLDSNERPYDPMAEDYGNAWVTSRPNSNYKRK